MAKTELGAPPQHLSERAVTLWHQVVPRRARSPERLALLIAALEALDRADEARKLIQQQGMVTAEGKGKMQHVNPLVKIERDNRGLFAKLWTQLNLQWDMEQDGRT